MTSTPENTGIIEPGKSISEIWSKNSLQLLYDITSTIQAETDKDELLYDLLELISHHVHAVAATVRLITDEGNMNLVSSIGLNKDQIKTLKHTPIDGKLFQRNHNPVDEIQQGSITNFDYPNHSVIWTVPVRYQLRTLGVINLMLPDNTINLNDETARLLIKIGLHLGLAIDQYRFDKELTQKAIQQERNNLANELHDSLAQTLASLKFQVRILDETLQPSSDFMAITTIEKVEHGLDEAYTELRELMAHCRVPLEKQGLIKVLERAVEKFREDTDIHILLQCDCEEPYVPAHMEMNSFRIVQEALTNIKKHTDAKIVRLLLKNTDNHYRILIENDGDGFNKDDITSEAGKHLGLTIMQERARHLGGELKIESEPDEGTRIELTFSYPTELEQLE